MDYLPYCNRLLYLCSVPVLLGLQLLVVLVKVCELLPHSQQLRLVGLQQLLHADDLLPILQLFTSAIKSLLLSLIPNSQRLFSERLTTLGPYLYSGIKLSSSVADP